jgi:hypothetical protein
MRGGGMAAKAPVSRKKAAKPIFVMKKPELLVYRIMQPMRCVELRLAVPRTLLSAETSDLNFLA